MRKRIIVCGHPVDRCDRPQRAGKVIGSAVANNADGANGQDGDEGLPDLVIEPVLANLIYINRIGSAQNVEFLAGNFSRAADRKAGARKGVATDERCGQAQLAPQCPHFIFEQLTKRFNQAQAHFFRQAADIVM